MTLPIGKPGIRVSVGMSGAGKTHGIKREVLEAARVHPVLVIDRMAEWEEGDAGAYDVPTAVAEIEKGAKLVIVRPTDIDAATEAACRWAKRHRHELTGLVFPEAQRAWPNGRISSHDAEDVITQFRHWRVAAWFDTQRIALLNRTVTEQAGDLRLYAIAGNLDLRVVDELGGSELVEAVRVCTRKLVDGEPGWHVRLGPLRVPPFRVSR